MSVNHLINNRFAKLSDWESTYNNAIDIIAEAVGHAKKVDTRYVKSIRLKPSAYANFVEGTKVLMAQRGQQWDPLVELTFEGVLILEGSKAQMDTVKFEYMENAVNAKLAN